jgi:hypothetical protein
MRIYLAARYNRHPEMRVVRDRLQALGHEVTSRWIDLHGGELEESVTQRDLNFAPEIGRPFAETDLHDVSVSDVVASFTSEDGGGKGGRHVEFGVGLALGKRTIVVGPRENVFHTLWTVEHHPDLESFLMAMEGA